MTKPQKVSYYFLLVMISVLFAFSGYSKLAAVPEAAQSFQVAHLPIWFMYFVGMCELLGAIGLWMPGRRLANWAGAGLFVILAGAVVTSAMFVNAPTALFPLFVALMLIVLLWLGKKRQPVAASAGPSSTPAPTPTSA